MPELSFRFCTGLAARPRRIQGSRVRGFRFRRCWLPWPPDAEENLKERRICNA